MRQDLLAPPVIKPPVLRRVAVGVCVVAAVIGVAIGWFTGDSLWGWAGIGVRLGMVVCLAAAWVRVMLWLGRVGAACRTERLGFVHAVNSVMGLLFFYLAAIIMLLGTSGRFGGMFVGQMIMWVGMMFGAMLFIGGLGRRVGESLHCPRCEYEFGFADRDDPPVRCPECGSGWLGLLKKGRKVRSERMMIAGVVIALLGVAVSSPVFYIRRLAPYLPTPVLYAMVYVSPVGNDAAWKEMQVRPLEESWSRRLEQRVLAHRAEWSYEDGGGRWMESRIAAGSVDDAARARLFREGFQAELVMPASVRAGEEFEVALRVRRAADAGSLHLGVMFEGYSVDMGPFSGRHGATLWGYELRPDLFRTHKDMCVQRVRAEGVKPGEMLRVQAVCWVMYVPGFDRSEWQGRGTPTRPPKAVWFERVELEGEVRVE